MPKSIKSFMKGIKPFLANKYGEEKAEAMISEIKINYDKLCEDNIDEPECVKRHTHKNIYPGVAAFYAQTAHGADREEAVRTVWDYMSWTSSKAHKMLVGILKIPFLYKLIPVIFVKMTKRVFGTDSGFKHKFYDTDKTEARFDMLECPYCRICEKNGCPELTKVFCHTDDVCYAYMHPKLIWHRTKTLGTGGDCCDFHIKIDRER